MEWMCKQTHLKTMPTNSIKRQYVRVVKETDSKSADVQFLKRGFSQPSRVSTFFLTQNILILRNKHTSKLQSTDLAGKSASEFDDLGMKDREKISKIEDRMSMSRTIP